MSPYLQIQSFCFSSCCPPGVRGQGGISLLETLVALGVLAYIGVTILTALQTNSRATGILEERVVAQNLATAGIESAKQSPFADTYPNAGANITVPFQYSVVIDTYGTNDYITWVHPCSGQKLQKIVVTVSRAEKQVFSISTYRAKR